MGEVLGERAGSEEAMRKKIYSEAQQITLNEETLGMQIQLLIEDRKSVV